MLKRFLLIGLWLVVSVSLSFAQWETPVNLGSPVNFSGDDARASISADGNTLFFSSYGRSGGHGEYDIWVTTKDGDVWQTPTNPGSPINTSFWDFLPCISSDGNTLYFASNRTGSQGLDIWESRRVGNVWQTPVNLAPINSSGSE